MYINCSFAVLENSLKVQEKFTILQRIFFVCSQRRLKPKLSPVIYCVIHIQVIKETRNTPGVVKHLTVTELLAYNITLQTKDFVSCPKLYKSLFLYNHPTRRTHCFSCNNFFVCKPTPTYHLSLQYTQEQFALSIITVTLYTVLNNKS